MLVVGTGLMICTILPEVIVVLTVPDVFLIVKYWRAAFEGSMICTREPDVIVVLSVPYQMVAVL